MKRINFFLKENLFNYLKALPEPLSEHLRRAVEEYVVKLQGINASASQSKIKGDK